jgi:hypothetical protein
MAYIYQIGFTVEQEQMEELKIGASLERVLGYLRILLASQEGYVTSRAMVSLDTEERRRVLFETMWESWPDLEGHRESALAEDKVLLEFAPNVTQGDLSVHIYQEID